MKGLPLTVGAFGQLPLANQEQGIDYSNEKTVQKKFRPPLGYRIVFWNIQRKPAVIRRDETGKASHTAG